MDEQLRLGDSDALITLKQAWERSLSLLSEEVGRPSFEFLKSAKPISMDGHTATIGAQSEMGRIFLEKYSEQLRCALESCLGSEVELTFTLLPREEPKPRPRETREPKQTGGIISPVSMPLNDKYTFSTFVVGPCNRLAHAAAQAVAQKPGKVYNPFFLYGGPGLGKTHLLQAIGRHVLANHTGVRVAYVSAEQFTQHYVTAICEHRSEEFRRQYRGVDVLLIDDIQFLAGKERTREEFFHTFNILYQTDKQIVLCSDRSPRDLGSIEDRLKSRFESGLVVDIAPPDLETKIAILQTKALAEKTEIPYPVLECIAGMIQTNVRALEGALVTLLAYTSLMKEPLSVSLAEEVLSRYLVEKKYAELTPDTIQRTVAKAFDMDAKELVGSKRDKKIVSVRHIAMYLSRELTPASLQSIGKAFGGRSHATVIGACNSVREDLSADPSFKATVDGIADDLRSGRA